MLGHEARRLAPAASIPRRARLVRDVRRVDGLNCCEYRARGYSSAGRARDWQSRGRRFEPGSSRNEGPSDSGGPSCFGRGADTAARASCRHPSEGRAQRIVRCAAAMPRSAVERARRLHRVSPASTRWVTRESRDAGSRPIRRVSGAALPEASRAEIERWPPRAAGARAPAPAVAGVELYEPGPRSSRRHGGRRDPCTTVRGCSWTSATTDPEESRTTSTRRPTGTYSTSSRPPGDGSSQRAPQPRGAGDAIADWLDGRPGLEAAARSRFAAR